MKSFLKLLVGVCLTSTITFSLSLSVCGIQPFLRGTISAISEQSPHSDWPFCLNCPGKHIRQLQPTHWSSLQSLRSLAVFHRCLRVSVTISESHATQHSPFSKLLQTRFACRLSPLMRARAILSFWEPFTDLLFRKFYFGVETLYSKLC